MIALWFIRPKNRVRWKQGQAAEDSLRVTPQVEIRRKTEPQKQKSRLRAWIKRDRIHLRAPKKNKRKKEDLKQRWAVCWFIFSRRFTEYKKPDYYSDFFLKDQFWLFSLNFKVGINYWLRGTKINTIKKLSKTGIWYWRPRWLEVSWLKVWFLISKTKLFDILGTPWGLFSDVLVNCKTSKL